jgi:3-oxoacyl-[acyl-carrier-protein] synthase II
MNDSVLPATLNLEDPIESGSIKLISKEPLKEKADIALSNSFGFGGTNTALLFKSI